MSTPRPPFLLLMPQFFRRSVHLTVALAAFLIVLICAIIQFIVWQRMEASVEQTMIAAETQAHLDTAFSLIQDAESGKRGFLLTGEESFMPGTPAHAVAWHITVRKLRQMEMSTSAALQNTLATTEALDFAGRLLMLAAAADCPPLRSYADTLRQNAASYAADDLEKHVAAFPQLIALLEERLARKSSHAPV